MSKHTKVPWKVVGPLIFGNSGPAICQVTQHRGDPVIAAAPTMADELIRALAVIRSPESFEVEGVCSDIEAVLRQAGVR